MRTVRQGSDLRPRATRRICSLGRVRPGPSAQSLSWMKAVEIAGETESVLAVECASCPRSTIFSMCWSAGNHGRATRKRSGAPVASHFRLISVTGRVFRTRPGPKALELDMASRPHRCHPCRSALQSFGPPVQDNRDGPSPTVQTVKRLASGPNRSTVWEPSARYGTHKRVSGKQSRWMGCYHRNIL